MSKHLERDTGVTLLEFTLTATSYPFVAASETGADVVLEEMLPRGDRGYAEFFSVDGGDPGHVEALADERGEAETDLLVEQGDGGLVEIVVEDNCPAVTLADAGALPRSVEGRDGCGRVTAEVPADTDPAEVADRFLSAHPDARLDSKTQQSYETPMFSPDELQEAIDDSLTDRQLEVLEAAHREGYYEWPRETNGEELADALGISPPTLHDHLRSAERKLVSLVFDAAGNRAGGSRRA